MRTEWNGFVPGEWAKGVNVRDFIISNYKPYDGDESFLAKPTKRTVTLLEKYNELHKKELEKGGVLDIDAETVSSLTTYKPGYLDKKNELIVGLQTDEPLKRGVNPFGGIRMARAACEAYGYKLSQKIEDQFKYRTTHNDGVFRAYTSTMRKARKSGIITGLPDAYGRGRIIGDYRRVALYGTDYLIEFKKQDMTELENVPMTEENIRLREEVFRQIEYLNLLKEMGEMYGYDISKPAKDAHEAVQWIYFAYLAAIKEQNGAAMSLGRVSTFLDIYFERDLKSGLLNEAQAQEIIEGLASYTEVSPSGRGLHIFVTANDANIIRHRKQGGFVEIYTNARYFTMTGNAYGGYDHIAHRSAELQKIHDQYLLPETPMENAFSHFVESPLYVTDCLRRGLEKDPILRACWNGERRCGDESASDQALMNKLAYWCNANPGEMIAAFLQSPYFSQKGDVHQKKCRRADYLPNTAKTACATLRSTAHEDTMKYRQSKSRDEAR